MAHGQPVCTLDEFQKNETVSKNKTESTEDRCPRLTSGVYMHTMVQKQALMAIVLNRVS